MIAPSVRLSLFSLALGLIALPAILGLGLQLLIALDR